MEDCTCNLIDPSAACNACRDRYAWRLERALTADISPWQFNEPKDNERCVRLTDEGEWNGTPCGTQLDYVCYKGVFV